MVGVAVTPLENDFRNPTSYRDVEFHNWRRSVTSRGRLVGANEEQEPMIDGLCKTRRSYSLARPHSCSFTGRIFAELCCNGKPHVAEDLRGWSRELRPGYISFGVAPCFETIFESPLEARTSGT